jgi:molecular chaperone IbpA
MTRLEKELNSIIDSMLFPSRYATTYRRTDTSYPPYNIIRLDDTKTVLELAVAGFKEEEISVTVENGYLKVSGKKTKNNDTHYLYKGISTRAFEKVFALSNDTKVDGANYADGILSIHISYEIPEEKKPKQIAINRGERVYLTE